MFPSVFKIYYHPPPLSPLCSSPSPFKIPTLTTSFTPLFYFFRFKDNEIDYAMLTEVTNEYKASFIPFLNEFRLPYDAVNIDYYLWTRDNSTDKSNQNNKFHTIL
jgi:hypothetical protein